MVELKKPYRRILTYSRLGSLSNMYYYGKEEKEGISYKDLKAALGLSDSTLAPQLSWLKEKGYVESKEEPLNNEKQLVYYITDKGREVYEAVLDWLNSLPLGEDLEKRKVE
jgi:DNA-binding MarR family transcriptional regulator